VIPLLRFPLSAVPGKQGSERMMQIAADPAISAPTEPGAVSAALRTWLPVHIEGVDLLRAALAYKLARRLDDDSLPPYMVPKLVCGLRAVIAEMHDAREADEREAARAGPGSRFEFRKGYSPSRGNRRPSGGSLERCLLCSPYLCGGGARVFCSGDEREVARDHSRYSDVLRSVSPSVGRLLSRSSVGTIAHPRATALGS
jgi:hypothetical protein